MMCLLMFSIGWILKPIKYLPIKFKIIHYFVLVINLNTRLFNVQCSLYHSKLHKFNGSLKCFGQLINNHTCMLIYYSEFWIFVLTIIFCPLNVINVIILFIIFTAKSNLIWNYVYFHQSIQFALGPLRWS